MISVDCCYDQGHVDVGDSTQERHVIITSWFNWALTQLYNNRIETHFDGVMSAFVFPWVPIACLCDMTYVCANWDKPQASRLQAARLPVRLAVSTSWWVQVRDGWSIREVRARSRYYPERWLCSWSEFTTWNYQHSGVLLNTKLPTLCNHIHVLWLYVQCTSDILDRLLLSICSSHISYYTQHSQI